jgi:hypothetical protein
MGNLLFKKTDEVFVQIMTAHIPAPPPYVDVLHTAVGTLFPPANGQRIEKPY